MLFTCVNHTKGRTFSRSYGTILPSSFTRVLSSSLVFSTCPPVSVCGTVLYKLWLAAFPGSLASVTSSRISTDSFNTSALIELRICLKSPPSCLYLVYQPQAQPSLLRPHFTTYKKSRNINLVPINYAFPPRLRGRLTLLRLT